MTITFIIIVFTVATSIASFPPEVVSIEAIRNTHFFPRFSFNPFSIKKFNQFERFITHGFIHVNWWHLIFNMLTLYFFAPQIESLYKHFYGKSIGSIIFILFYFSAIIVSSIFDYFKYNKTSSYNAVGASGAVSATIFSYILFAPQSKLYMFFIPIPIPAWIFGLVYLFYSAYMAKKNVDNIGHSAHFWGGVWGLIFPFLFINYQTIIRVFIDQLLYY